MTATQNIDLTGRERIAHASTHDGARKQWTELAIWYVPDATGRVFVARIEGHSSVAGQTTRVRAVHVGSIDRALSFFDVGDLQDAMAVQAEDWMERNRSRPVNDVAALRAAEEAAPTGSVIGYQGSTLLQAVAWLYGDAQAGKAARLAEDFGVPRRTVADALDKEQTGQPLSGWAKAFVTALKFFNRDLFAASRGTN